MPRGTMRARVGSMLASVACDSARGLLYRTVDRRINPISTSVKQNGCYEAGTHR